LDSASTAHAYCIGADENGLGARLGPLVVTGVLACVAEPSDRALRRKLPARVAADLDDSKRLVSHGNIALGEAWARVLGPPDAASPRELFEGLSLEGVGRLRDPCPSHVETQCWSAEGERFQADDELVARVRRHLTALRRRGIEIERVQSSVVCTRRLNDKRAAGQNRFVADLHAMEELVLSLRAHAGSDVTAVCGKVGGIGDYPRFFGPLSGRLHAVLEQRRALGAYRFPGLGEIRFEQDADARHVLVMLASLVGKYVRELLMARIPRFYASPGDDTAASCSGYNDPVTDRFVELTLPARCRRRIPRTCFERESAKDADG